MGTLTEVNSAHTAQKEPSGYGLEWKKIPECGFVKKGETEKLWCTYKYESERLVLSKAVSSRVIENNNEDALKECSAKYCPFRLRLGI